MANPARSLTYLQTGFFPIKQMLRALSTASIAPCACLQQFNQLRDRGTRVAAPVEQRQAVCLVALLKGIGTGQRMLYQETQTPAVRGHMLKVFRFHKSFLSRWQLVSKVQADYHIKRVHRFSGYLACVRQRALRHRTRRNIVFRKTVRFIYSGTLCRNTISLLFGQPAAHENSLLPRQSKTPASA